MNNNYDSRTLSEEDIASLSNRHLNLIYHNSELYAVHCIVTGQYYEALGWLSHAVDLRTVVASRLGGGDVGHMAYINQLIAEQRLVNEAIADVLDKRYTQYRFGMGCLVGTAMVCGVYVPRAFWPDGWSLRLYKATNSYYRRMQAKYQRQTITRCVSYNPAPAYQERRTERYASAQRQDAVHYRPASHAIYQY